MNGHHIATDTWSLIVLMEELGLLYAARVAGVQPNCLPPGTRIPIIWPIMWHGRPMLDAAAGQAHWRYWQAQLAALPSLDLPTERPRPPIGRHVGPAILSGSAKN